MLGKTHNLELKIGNMERKHNNINTVNSRFAGCISLDTGLPRPEPGEGWALD